MSEPRYIVATCPNEGPDRFFPLAEPGGSPTEHPTREAAFVVGEAELRKKSCRAFQIWTVDETYEAVVEIRVRSEPAVAQPAKLRAV